MKKIIISFLVATAFTASLNAAMLTGEQTNGMKKVCFYSDGTAFSISITSLCPLSI